jgi:hypothetical protein
LSEVLVISGISAKWDCRIKLIQYGNVESGVNSDSRQYDKTPEIREEPGRQIVKYSIITVKPDIESGSRPF